MMKAVDTAGAFYRISTGGLANLFVAAHALADQSDNYEDRTDFQIASFLYIIATLLIFFATAGVILLIVRKVVSRKP